MHAPAVVPAPASIEASGAAPFRLVGRRAHRGRSGCRRRPVRADSGARGPRARRCARSRADRRCGSRRAERRVVPDHRGCGIRRRHRRRRRRPLLRRADPRPADHAATATASSIPAVQIDDAPRFAYRGVMLDVARHFLPVETVKAYIDRAAGLKFNALHLHLTDDQGWRIHLDSRPKLTELAAATAVGGDAGGFFSKADYREIVEYAASRHMIVVPEVDLPGHTHAVGLAYPELAEAPVLSPHILEIVESHGGAVPTAGEPYTGMGVGLLVAEDPRRGDVRLRGRCRRRARGDDARAVPAHRRRRSARHDARGLRAVHGARDRDRRRPRQDARSPGTRPARRRASTRARSGSTGASSPRPTAWTRRRAPSCATTRA